MQEYWHLFQFFLNSSLYLKMSSDMYHFKNTFIFFILFGNAKHIISISIFPPLPNFCHQIQYAQLLQLFLISVYSQKMRLKYVELETLLHIY